MIGDVENWGRADTEPAASTVAAGVIGDADSWGSDPSPARTVSEGDAAREVAAEAGREAEANASGNASWAMVNKAVTPSAAMASVRSLRGVSSTACTTSGNDSAQMPLALYMLFRRDRKASFFVVLDVGPRRVSRRANWVTPDAARSIGLRLDDLLLDLVRGSLAEAPPVSNVDASPGSTSTTCGTLSNLMADGLRPVVPFAEVDTSEDALAEAAVTGEAKGGTGGEKAGGCWRSSRAACHRKRLGAPRRVMFPDESMGGGANKHSVRTFGSEDFEPGASKNFFLARRRPSQAPKELVERRC